MKKGMKMRMKKKGKDEEKDKDRRKITIFLVGLILIFLVVAVFYIVKNGKDGRGNGDGENDEGDETFCSKDSDCIKKQTTCCPCSAGGREECINVKEDREILCPPQNEFVCPQVYNCREISCSCINGKCSEA